jgi:hypothetical protein
MFFLKGLWDFVFFQKQILLRQIGCHYVTIAIETGEVILRQDEDQFKTPLLDFPAFPAGVLLMRCTQKAR